MPEVDSGSQRSEALRTAIAGLVAARPYLAAMLRRLRGQAGIDTGDLTGTDPPLTEPPLAEPPLTEPPLADLPGGGEPLPIDLIDSIVADSAVPELAERFEADLTEAAALAGSTPDRDGLVRALRDRDIATTVLTYLAARALQEGRSELATKALLGAAGGSVSRTGAVEGLGVCRHAHGGKSGAPALRPVFEGNSFYWECTENPAHRLKVWTGTLEFGPTTQSGGWT